MCLFKIFQNLHLIMVLMILIFIEVKLYGKVLQDFKNHKMKTITNFKKVSLTYEELIKSERSVKYTTKIIFAFENYYTKAKEDCYK